jgi:enamine deaminase RidA (YjgF/YER057c/UK114 family)
MPSSKTTAASKAKASAKAAAAAKGPAKAKAPSKAIRRLQPGPRMSQAVIHGGVAYLAGQVAQNTKGKSVTEQTKDVLAAIDGLLKASGTSKAKLLTAQIWLTDMKTFAEMNAAWDAWVSPGNTPARATVQSPALAAPGYDVEIMVTAAVK